MRTKDADYAAFGNMVTAVCCSRRAQSYRRRSHMCGKQRPEPSMGRAPAAYHKASYPLFRASFSLSKRNLSWLELASSFNSKSMALSACSI